MNILALMILGMMVVGCGKTGRPDEPVKGPSPKPTDQNTTKPTPEKTNTSTNSPPKPTDQNSTKPTPTKELSLREKVVGTYEAKKEETTVKLVLLENGKSEHWVNGEKKGKATWKLRKPGAKANQELSLAVKEVHVLGRKRLFFGDGEDARVYKIESNGDLTWIANIRDGKREDVPSEEQFTSKKIK